MSNGDAALQKVVSCIPQVYFDIIGRVIPGTLIMGSTWIAVRGTYKFWESLKSCLVKSTISSATLATVLVILTSYVLAFLIWCFWSCLITIICKLCKVCDKPECRMKKWVCEKIYWDNEDFRKKYEKLKYYNTAAGNRITKLKAQIHMAETLFIGLPPSCLVGIITYLLGAIEQPPPLIYFIISWIFLLVAAFCSLFARQYCIAHMNDSLNNNLRILNAKEVWKSRN